ncbi:MAG TPA: capsular biosynthesis protein, partial [Bacteroidales bacterium]|nr:capsular biosynthesis protein [Bacteroidales bacterium]
NIQRDFNINDQIYTFLLEKSAEAGITKASNIADHKILDKALPNNAVRIKPKPSSNYMLSLVVGFLIPLVIIILREFFNNKILGKRDIENATSVPILGSVGHNEKHTEIPVFENPKTALSESFRALRANLHFMLKEKNEKVIAVSSTISGEGKTFCAVNLAAIMAMAGKKTLLVGLDLRRPKIHRIFNLNNDAGLSTFLAGRSEANDIVQSTNVESLSIVNSGPVPPNPAELIGSERLVEFIESMKTQFDYIVIDTPPIAIVTDALLLKDLINTYIFVIRHDYSDRSVLKLVDELYTRRGVSNMSILVNDIQVKGYYGYNYSYNYGYGYGYTYRYGQSYYDAEGEFKGIWPKIKYSLFRKR